MVETRNFCGPQAGTGRWAGGHRKKTGRAIPAQGQGGVSAQELALWRSGKAERPAGWAGWGRTRQGQPCCRFFDTAKRPQIVRDGAMIHPVIPP
jgi:hypothetical protein